MKKCHKKCHISSFCDVFYVKFMLTMLLKINIKLTLFSIVTKKVSQCDVFEKFLSHKKVNKIKGFRGV